MDKTMVEQEIILRRKLDLLLRTGKILVESAADTNRIVRNMNRVAAYLGLPEENLHIDVTYTMLVVNLSDESHSYSKFQKCEKHGINMTAISEISKLSWRAIEEDYSLDRYEEELEKIKSKKRNYTPYLVAIGAGFACGGFCKLFGSDWGCISVCLHRRFCRFPCPCALHRVRYQSVYEHHHCGAGVHMSGLYHHLYRAFGHALPSATGVRAVHCAGSSHYKLCGRHD